MSNWLEIAKRKFPDAKIIGTGRWALQPLDSPKTVLLFESYLEARSQVQDETRVSITELKLEDDMDVLSRVRDVYDRDEARRERREKECLRFPR